MINSARNTRFITEGSPPNPPNRTSRASAARLLESGDAFGHIAIVDIHRVDLGKTLSRRFWSSSRFLGNAQIIPQGEDAFRFDAGSLKSALVPDGRDPRLAFLHERQAKQRAALHGISERSAALVGLGHFLEFADGFFEQPHFAERRAEVVVR